MYERIMVPLDGTPFGEYAIRYATSIALRSGATLELVHVHIPAHLEAELFAVPLFHYTGIVESDAAYDHDHLVREREQLVERAQKLSEETGLRVTTRVAVGAVDRGVEREAEAFGADLIVMSTHARTALERARLGSVGDAVVRHAKALVLLVHPDATGTAAAAAPVFERILVPLDGSEFSERILEPAGRLALLFGAEVMLLNVQSSPQPPVFSRAVRDPAGHRTSRSLMVEQYLDHVAARHAGVIRNPVLEAATAPSPIAGILDTVRIRKPDLIAMATHARGGLRRMLLGSTASEVARKADVPVLLLRPAADESRVNKDPVAARTVA